MSAVAAYKAQIRAGSSSVEMTDEATEELNGGVIYRIIDETRRVIDPAEPFVVKSMDGDVELGLLAVNYLAGTFMIEDVHLIGAGPVVVSEAHYVPLSLVGCAKDYNLEIGGDVLDNTCFHSDTDLSSGYRTRIYGLHDASLTLSRFGDDNKFLRDAKMDEIRVMVEVRPGGEVIIGGWYVVETDANSGEVAGLEEESITLQLDGRSVEAFSYVYDWDSATFQGLDQVYVIDMFFPDFDGVVISPP